MIKLKNILNEQSIGGILHRIIWPEDTMGNLAAAAARALKAKFATAVELNDAFQKAFEKCPKPLWLSLTLDDNHGTDDIKLRSGETLLTAIETIKEKSIDALLFNCSQPEAMTDAVSLASTLLKDKIQIGVYANAFPPRNDHTTASNAELSQIRSDLTPQKYKIFAREWVEQGASIIGGCCGVGPEHIKALRQLSEQNPY